MPGNSERALQEVSDALLNDLDRLARLDETPREAVAARANGQASASALRSIDETPRAMHAILEEWRAAERGMGAAAAGTADHATAALDAERLRQEYQRRFAERQSSDASR